jgi:hypothetical protein
VVCPDCQRKPEADDHASPSQSGAPAWTLEHAGLDLSNEGQKLEEAGAAYLGGVKSRGKPLEGDRGLWPTGYQKLSCATMK